MRRSETRNLLTCRTELGPEAGLRFDLCAPTSTGRLPVSAMGRKRTLRLSSRPERSKPGRPEARPSGQRWCNTRATQIPNPMLYKAYMPSLIQSIMGATERRKALGAGVCMGNILAAPCTGHFIAGRPVDRHQRPLNGPHTSHRLVAAVAGIESDAVAIGVLHRKIMVAV